MKKILCLLLTLVVVFLTSTTIYANSTNEINALGNIAIEIDDSDFIVQDSKTKAFKATNIPSSYSLPALGLDTPVKNQNPYGTCWSFAIAASSESSYLLTHNTKIDLSELQLVYNMSQRKDDPLNLTTGDRNIWRNDNKSEQNLNQILETGGNSWLASYSLTSGYVFCDEEKVPYSLASTINNRRLPADNEKDNKYYISDVYWLSFKDPETIKSVLMQYGSVTISIYWDNKYYNNSNHSYYCPTSKTSNHTVTLVGWDDNYSTNDFTYRPASSGAWLIKNSWGTSWGDNGYFWLSYQDKTIESDSEKFICDDKDEDSFIYQYDSTGAYSSTVSAPSQITGANIYTSQYDGLLDRVGFYCQQANTNYRVRIYSDVIANNPTSGNLLYDQKGSFTYAGYNSFELSQPLLLKKDQNFSVVVTIYNEKTAYFVVDKNIDNDWIYFLNKSNASQSFFSFSNDDNFMSKEYVESSETNYLTARIKAYVTKINDGLIYEDEQKTIIKEYIGSQQEVVIPDSVKTIRKAVFKDKTNITSLVVGANVETIESEAFKNCINIKSITLPETITTIASDSFDNVKPTVLNVPESQKIIDIPAIEATCTTGGRTASYHYALLETLKVDSLTLKPLGHHLDAYHQPKEPTCEDVGNIGYYQCDRCQKYFNRDLQETTKVFIEQLGHNYIFTRFIWSDDFTAKALYTCSNDSSHTVEYQAAITKECLAKPTCTLEGLNIYICSYGGQAETKTEVVKPLGHNYQFDCFIWHDYDAKAIYKCTNDESHQSQYQAIVIDTLIQKPDCTTQGLRTYQAYYDGHNSSKDEILPYYHEVQYFPYIRSDYQQGGIKEHYCCQKCLHYFLDQQATNEVSYSSLLISKLKAPTKLATPTFKLSCSPLQSINLTINKVKDGSKYDIYRSTSSSKGFVKLASIDVDLLDENDTSKTIVYNDYDVTYNKTYYYKVKAIFDATNTSKVISSSYSKVLSTKLPFSSDQYSLDYTSDVDSITININKTNDDFSYAIYRSTNNKTFTLLADNVIASFTDKTIKPNTYYYYKIKTLYNGFASSYSAVKKAKTTLKTPSIASLKAQNAHSVLININTVANGEIYHIYRSYSSSKSYQLIAQTKNSSFIDEDVKPNVNVYYKVLTSTAGNNKSSYSSYKYVKTPFKATKITSVKANDVNELLISFNPTSDAISYDIYRSTNKKKYTLVANTTNTSYLDTVKANTTYYYKVIARNIKGYTSPASNIVSNKAKYTIGKISPIKSYSCDSLTITYQGANYDSLYEIYRSTNKKKYEKIAETYELSYVDTNLSYGKTYYYKVRALAKDNYTAYSSVASGKVLLDSPTIKVKAINVNSLQIDISSSNYDNTTYDIYRSTNNKTFTCIQQNLDSNTYIDETAVYNKTYYYKVKAHSQSCSSSFSKAVSSKTTITAASKLKAVVNANGSLTLTFADNNYRDYYEIYRSTNKKTYQLITTINTNQFVDTTVIINKTYYYKVRSVSSNGKTKDSSVITKKVVLPK